MRISDWSSDVCSSDLSVASSGTPFLQSIKHARARGIALDYFCLGVSESANTRRLFSTADATGTRYLRDRELTVANVDVKIAQLLQWLQPAQAIHLPICLDFLPPSPSPGFSAPSARGIAIYLIHAFLALVVG